MDAIERVKRSPRIGSTADAKRGSEINCGSMQRHRDNPFNADEAKEILDSLLQNKQLETLVMDNSPNFGSLESCRALQELVRTSKTLKNLSLCEVRMNGEGLKLIVEGILSNSQSALEALSLGGNKELGLCVDISAKQFSNRVIFVESWRVLGKLVRTSTTLKHLSLRHMGMNGEDLKLIVEGILSNSQSALEALDLGNNYLLVSADVNGVTEQSTDRVNVLESWRALGELVRTSRTLKHLSLINTGMRGEHLKHIVEGIQNNSQAGLETLELWGNQELGYTRVMLDDDTQISEGVKQLTDLLLGNTRALATLDIGGIGFSEDEMKSMGKALASNTTLINLSLPNLWVRLPRLYHFLF